MREYETAVSTHEYQRCTKLICDLCGKEGLEGKWESGYYEDNETTLEVKVHAKKGTSYPDGDCWGKQITVDVCPGCFREKLIPWINSQGGNVKEQEFGW